MQVRWGMAFESNSVLIFLTLFHPASVHSVRTDSENQRATGVAPENIFCLNSYLSKRKECEFPVSVVAISSHFNSKQKRKMQMDVGACFCREVRCVYTSRIHIHFHLWKATTLQTEHSVYLISVRTNGCWLITPVITYTFVNYGTLCCLVLMLLCPPGVTCYGSRCLSCTWGSVGKGRSQRWEGSEVPRSLGRTGHRF